MLAVWRLLGGQPPRRSFRRIARTGPPDAPPSVRLLGRDLTPARLSGDIWTLAPSPGAIRTLPRLSGDIWTLPPLSGYIWTFSSPPNVRKPPKKSLPSPGLFSPRNGRRFTSARCSNISAVSLNRLNYASYHPVRLPYRIRILIDIDGTRVIVLALTAHRPAVCQA